ncbi:hypothetical protein ACHAQJ_009386 [Trichoderma viride]
MLTKFVYKALESPNSEIRLLKLLPGTGSQKVQCHLSASPLSDLPAYQPLSYCWGPQTNLVEILVNGESFLVTRNLAAALRRLRQPKASCILWVDAICVNQQDKLEKNIQIPMMTEIYQRGKQTIVWLGDHDRKTARAFAMLETMATYVDTVPKEKSIRLDPDKWRFLKKAMKKKASAEIEPDDFKPALRSPAYWMSKIRSGDARISIFGRAWFKRVWILQEIAVSLCAVVVCGQYSINWTTLEKAYSMSEFWDEWEDGQYLRTLIELRTSIQAGTRDELGVLVLKAVYCQATEPMDRIYAILGLAKKLPLEFDIAVDYTVDTYAKFIEATRACLASTGDAHLTLTGCRSHLSNNDLLPSWAWSPQPDPEQPTYQWQFHRAAAKKCLFRAAGKESEKSSISFSDDGRLLSLRGIVFDTIVDVGPVFGNVRVGYKFQVYGSGFRMGDKQMPRYCLTHLVASKRVADPAGPGLYPGKKNKTRRQAWISFLTSIAMMSDGMTDEREIVEEKVRLEEVQAKPYHIFGRGPGELPWSKTKPLLHDPQMPRLQISMLQTRLMISIAMEYMAKRRVVRTSQGYIGLCDRYTEIGDHLAIISGICVPVILRPAMKGQWRMIGESYVYGVMHGQLWSDDKAQSLHII